MKKLVAVTNDQWPLTQKWNWNPFHPELIDDPSSLWIEKDVWIQTSSHQKFVLLIGRKTLQLTSLALELSNSQIPFVMIDWDAFIYHGGVQFHINSKGTKLLFEWENKKINLKNAHTIYFNSPESVEVLWDVPGEFKSSEIIFLKRWHSLLLELESLLICRWVPGKPSQLIFGRQSKIADLKLATQLNLKIPESYLVNSIQAAKSITKSKSNMIFKEFGLRRILKSKKMYGIKISKIKKNDFTGNNKTGSPFLLQNTVPKNKEIRAYIIGNKCFSTSYTLKNEKEVDSRNADFSKIKVNQYKMDKKLKTKLIQFARKSEITFGAFDLIQKDQNEPLFLELNRPGAWLFMELLSGIPLRKNLASFLSRYK